MRRMWRFVAWVAGIAVVVVLVTPLFTTSIFNKPSGKKGDHKHDAANEPIPVLVAAARKADVPVYVEGVDLRADQHRVEREARADAFDVDRHVGRARLGDENRDGAVAAAPSPAPASAGGRVLAGVGGGGAILRRIREARRQERRDEGDDDRQPGDPGDEAPQAFHTKISFIGAIVPAGRAFGGLAAAPRRHTIGAAQRLI